MPLISIISGCVLIACGLAEYNILLIVIGMWLIFSGYIAD